MNEKPVFRCSLEITGTEHGEWQGTLQTDDETWAFRSVMQHIERTGIHSGDSIAVYPPFSIGDRMLRTILDSSEKLALSLGTRGLVNIQYLIYQGELYVIEVNPRASRTVPYISKVTGVPMVDLATRVMAI